jgi:hypothetical protein
VPRRWGVSGPEVIMISSLFATDSRLPKSRVDFRSQKHNMRISE